MTVEQIGAPDAEEWRADFIEAFGYPSSRPPRR